jgi:hypothetical protein
MIPEQVEVLTLASYEALAGVVTHAYPAAVVGSTSTPAIW